MKEGKSSYHPWQQLLSQNNDPTTQKSISSKASGPRSRFTPTKTPLKSPQNRLNLLTIKNRQPIPLQASYRTLQQTQKDQPHKQQKSMFVEPHSFKYLNPRNSSIDHGYLLSRQKEMEKDGDRDRERVKDKGRLGSQGSQVDIVVENLRGVQVGNGDCRSQEMEEEERELSRLEQENISKPLQMMRLDTFTDPHSRQPYSHISLKYQQHHQLQPSQQPHQQPHQQRYQQPHQPNQPQAQPQSHHHHQPPKPTTPKSQKNLNQNDQTQNIKNISVQRIFEDCMAGLNVMEEDMVNQRVEIQRILMEKQKMFQEFRLSLLEIFRRKEKQITKPENRKLLEYPVCQQQPQPKLQTQPQPQDKPQSHYQPQPTPQQFQLKIKTSQPELQLQLQPHPQTQRSAQPFPSPFPQPFPQPQQSPKHIRKFTLTRVTSQQIFNRLQRDTSQSNLLFTDREQSAHGRSVNSRGDSVYQKNFDRIFSTINKLKSELSDDAIELRNRINEINGYQPQSSTNSLHQPTTTNPINPIITKTSQILTNPQKQSPIKTTTIRSPETTSFTQHLNHINYTDHTQFNHKQPSTMTSNPYVEEWRNKLQRYKN